jgi:formylglycine-generating enzyme required for sulfatase activity
MKRRLLKRKIAIAVMSIRLLSAAPVGPFAATGPDPNPGKIKIKTNPQDEQPYVWIPSGNFTMGCSPGDDQCFSEEKPAHQVSISQGFWMGETEVTVAAYEKFAGITEGHEKSATRDVSSSDQENGQSTPAVNLTWDEAGDFCKWAGGRLPTEAEWEYAARAGTSTSRYGELDDIAWYEKNSRNTIHRVGQKRANRFGLFDMMGNAWEWVNDFYDGKYYSRSPQSDPTGPETGQLHGLRGGSWLNNAKLVRVSDRGRSTAELRFNYFGLRCVLKGDIRQRQE